MSELFAIWVIGIGATVVTVVLMWLIYFVYKAKVAEREERRLMIERGMVPPPPPNRGWPGVRARELELKAEERRLRIEKGLDIPPDPAPSPADTLKRGLVWAAIGLGLAGAYYVFNTSGVDASEETRNWFLFFGVISPAATLYGVANIIHYQLTKNRREPAASARDQVR